MGLISGIAGLVGGGPGNAYENINTPDPEAMAIQLEEYVQMGILTPEAAETILQDPSAFESIVTSPEFKEAQMMALSGLQDVANEGGLTAIDKAKLNDIARQEATQQRGSREAILQNAAERGVGGSGFEMMNQMKNQQASAGRQSDRGTQVAADAQERALQALIRSGEMGMDMEQNEFGMKSDIARAKDAVNRFNTSNLNATERANVNARNEAAASNLAAKQGVYDANVGGRNQAQQYNKQLYQQQFDNQMNKAHGVQSANQAGYDARMGAIGGIESGAAGLIGGAYGASQAAQLAKKKAQGGGGSW